MWCLRDDAASHDDTPKYCCNCGQVVSRDISAIRNSASNHTCNNTRNNKGSLGTDRTAHGVRNRGYECVCCTHK